MIDSPIPQSVLEASGVVGAWVHDHRAGRLALSGGFARLLGLDPAAAAEGLPLQAVLDRMHPDDQGRVENYFHAVAVAGGPVEAEFRTSESPAGTRTLLVRGRIARDGDGGTTRGQGIVIDRTEGPAMGPAQAEQIVNRMAEQVITLRGLAQALDRPALVQHVNNLMIEIGFELARFVPPPEDDARR